MWGWTELAAAGSFAGNGGEFAHYGEFAVLDGRGQHKAGDGIAIRQQGFDEGLEIGEGGGRHFEQEIVAAGKVMAFADLFEGLDVFKQAVVILSVAADANEGKDFEAESFAVDVDRVAAQDADFFHLLQALAGCGGGEADAAAKFGETEARVGLKFVEKLSSLRIKKRRGIHCHKPSSYVICPVYVTF